MKERESIDYSIKITTDMALSGEVFINEFISCNTSSIFTV